MRVSSDKKKLTEKEQLFLTAKLIERYAGKGDNPNGPRTKSEFVRRIVAEDGRLNPPTVAKVLDAACELAGYKLDSFVCSDDERVQNMLNAFEAEEWKKDYIIKLAQRVRELEDKTVPAVEKRCDDLQDQILKLKEQLNHITTP